MVKRNAPALVKEFGWLDLLVPLLAHITTQRNT